MKILWAVKKIPGGLMVVPLLLGVAINTSLGNVLWSAFDGTFTIYLWKLGAAPILAVFTFYNATTINFKKAGVMVYKGILITVVKVGVGIITGLIYGTLFGEESFLGLPALAIVGTLANSSGGLYAALAGEYGDATDVGAVSILSVSDGPFFIIVVLGAADVAKIPMSILIGCVVPAIVGYILGNLNEDTRKSCELSTAMLIPSLAFLLGVGLSIMNLLKARGPGTFLDITCTLITGLAGYLAYKLLRTDHPEVGGAVGTTADDTAVTPTSTAAVDTTLLVVAEAATAQITTAITATAILCPVLVSYLHKIKVHKRGR